MTGIRRAPMLLAVATVLALGGCASSVPSSTPSRAASAGQLHGSLTVYAAASLTASFDDLATSFSALHPAVTVKPIDYDGSSVLATQIIGGAPADVFASADQANMNAVRRAGLTVGTPKIFARNTLQIAVSPGNPKKITGLKSLANPAISVDLCAPAVPCGAAAHTLLKADGVSVTPVSEEQAVTAVVTKIEAGEVDAGLVYVTDVKASGGRVQGVTIADANKAVNRYPITVLKNAPNSRVAAAFTAYVLSPAGQKVLSSHGFAGP